MDLKKLEEILSAAFLGMLMVIALLATKQGRKAEKEGISPTVKMVLEHDRMLMLEERRRADARCGNTYQLRF